MGGSVGQGGRDAGEGSPLQVQVREGRALAALGGWELLRGLLVFALCSQPWLQRDPEAFLRASRRVLGPRLWRALLSVSLWGQFAVGRSPAAVQELSQRLRARGLRPMLALPIEGEGPDGEGEAWFEQNLGAALECVGLAAASGPEPAMQLKLTALLSQSLCEKISLRLAEPEGAGLSPEQVAAMLGGQVPELTWLSPAENQHLGRGLRRLEEVVQVAVARRVQVLVDAEMSHLNPALTCLTWGLMWRHNRAGPRPWVWNTWQAYLRGTEALLAAHLAQVGVAGLRCGVKLVRGAYLAQEQGRARARGCPSPTWDTPEETSDSYGRCLQLLLATLAQPGSRLSLMVATHNEASVLDVLDRLPRAPPGGAVCFAQLLGMGENLSLALGSGGFPVYRSVPLGPPEVTVPYLARRAAENRGALGGARRERQLLWAELWRRLRPWA
ncbi:PREDICTED: probable proline dehydrogenase 2 [Pseudopodoces humilis]|uniref:probable proline dehydrogenase 2 n=1 Tax=Pseudopodoces humilis TaxID=181119 RepID=UPI0006B73CC6|nr:PREDICTED: probable proline dehydrogenase 2 [Pseudopodoces humilis]